MSTPIYTSIYKIFLDNELRPPESSSLAFLSLSGRISPQCKEFEYSLSMVVVEDPLVNSPSLVIEFVGVRKLVLKQPELSVISAGSVEISELEVSPYMPRTYLVRDTSEDEFLQFECRGFSVSAAGGWVVPVCSAELEWGEPHGAGAGADV